jgi:hypothetical protein
MITIATHASRRPSDTSAISAATIRLVGDRVHELAERRDRVPRPRQIAVDRVGDRRDREHDRREQVTAAGLVEQRDDQHRHQQDAHDRQEIREIQRNHGRPTLAEITKSPLPRANDAR